MASKTKTRSGGKSPTQSTLTANSGTQNSRRSAKFKNKTATSSEKESLAFKVLAADCTKKVAEIQDVCDLEKSLGEVLQMLSPGVDLKADWTVDYFVSACWWAKEQGYNVDQLSAFYTVIHALLENIREHQMALTDNLKEFHKMLAGIGQDLPATGGGLDTLFDVNQAKHITSYVHNSLFQHYKLFEFMHAHAQAEDIIGTDLEVELPLAASVPWPPPLDEAISEELFLQNTAFPEDTAMEDSQETGSSLEPGESAADDTVTGIDEESAGSILTQLSTEEIETIVKTVFTERLGTLESEVAAKLREKENAFINQINKLHKTDV